MANNFTDKEIDFAISNYVRSAEYDVNGAILITSKDMLAINDLINRQQAEIEKQKNKTDVVIENYQNLIDRYVEARAEAIKEFLDKLIDVSVCKGNDDGTESLYVSISKARETLKEMVGE